MGEFNEFLEKADQCVRSGQWPAPGARSRRSGEPKQPGMSVDEAAQRIASLMERAAADPNMDMGAIENEVRAMQGMTMPQLKEAAEQAHLAARGRTKEDMLKALAVAIKERRMAGERGQRPMEAAAGEHRHEHHGHHGQPQHRPVGAAGGGNG